MENNIIYASEIYKNRENIEKTKRKEKMEKKNKPVNFLSNNIIFKLRQLGKKAKQNVVNLKVYKIYFNDLLNSENGYIFKSNLINFIEKKGISINDKRICNEIKNMNNKIFFDDFIKLLNTNIILFKKIFENELIIPNWCKFKKNIDMIYEKTKNITTGRLPTYIPQLANVNPELFSISILFN